MSIPVIAYIRVSRVGGREGSSFLSPELQLEAIEGECARSGLRIVDTLEELDASGGDNRRPLWNSAIRRVERGEAKGLVVWNLARFSRSLQDALKAIDRIENAGGRLYSASGEAGDDSPTGRLTRNLFLSIAEMERERAKDGFFDAQTKAIARGQHFASRTPTGYIKGEDKRLVPDPEMAPLVVGLFEMRARRKSWASMARWFIEAGGSPKTNPSAVGNMIRNRAYLGEARHGSKVNRKAHPAIVSRKLFDEANAVVGTKNRGDGSLTAKMLLLGIPTCDACGYRLQTVSSRYKNKETGFVETAPGYGCKTLTCKSRGYIRAGELDEFVTRILFRVLSLGGMGAVQRDAGTDSANDLAHAEKTVELAEYDKKLFVSNRDLRRILSAEEYNAELVSLAEVVTEAQIALEMVRSVHSAPPTVTPVMELWGEWTMESRREWIGKMVTSVSVRSANRKHGVPTGERVRLNFADFDDGEIGWEKVHVQPFADVIAPFSSVQVMERLRRNKNQ